MSTKLSNKTLIIMGVLLIVGWFIAQIIVSILFPTSAIPFSVPSFGAEVVFISVLIGFTLYSQRFRDERSIQISDKSARNGFAFVLFVIPVALIGFSATDISFDALLALAIVWIGAVAFAGISAFYYYHK
ncbi:MAG: hypothetical protein ACFFDQ_05540 [Candidatus Thorarchaeota archaeon]